MLYYVLLVTFINCFPVYVVLASPVHILKMILRLVKSLCKDDMQITEAFHIFLYQEQLPQCIICQTSRNVKHFPIECKAFHSRQKTPFNVNNMKDLFENTYIDEILSFLRETKL